MAHEAQIEFIKRTKRLYPERFERAANILEVGSQNINGTVRGFFNKDATYIGLDLGIAEGVDFVIPGELVELPDGWSDISISTECLEHCREWVTVVNNMSRITKPGGLVLITAAGRGRPAHGTVDTDSGSSPYTTDYYKNIELQDFNERVELDRLYSRYSFEYCVDAKDFYFLGFRNDHDFDLCGERWESIADRLARAQGQLAYASRVNNDLKAELRREQEQNATMRAELASEGSQNQRGRFRGLINRMIKKSAD